MLTRNPKETVITIANTPRLYERELRNEWTYEIHADKARLPPITFEYYDTTKEANVELRCDPPVVERRIERSAAKPAPPPRLPFQFDPVTGVGLDVAGALLVIASAMVLIRTIRR